MSVIRPTSSRCRICGEGCGRSCRQPRLYRSDCVISFKPIDGEQIEFVALAPCPRCGVQVCPDHVLSNGLASFGCCQRPDGRPVFALIVDWTLQSSGSIDRRRGRSRRHR